jgi:electron transfer flavoprotein beta subunit
VLTDDGQRIDTRHLGFTMSPHEECAVEEAVRITEQHGGSATVLTLGGPEAEEQIRQAMALGVGAGVLVDVGTADLDPQATAAGITTAIRALGEGGDPFDLILFGNESADAGNHQVAIRVAHALDLPVVSGIKGLELGDGRVRLRREIPDGYEVYELPLPACVAVREGLNLPRYPTMVGRLKARKALVRVESPDVVPGGLRKLRLVNPPQQEAQVQVLGRGPDAAPDVVDLLEELELL